MRIELRLTFDLDPTAPRAALMDMLRSIANELHDTCGVTNVAVDASNARDRTQAALDDVNEHTRSMN